MDIKDSLAKQIEKSKKEVTIVFTDIKGSTAFWEKHGDTEGRLMVDLHNKLMFAVVKSYKGTVVKTIGDSIMASFKKPKNALRAAISMQKVLWRRKREEKDLKIRIRIGIHTGEAIQEKNDIYGDVVNVAARVEGQAKGDEIVVSKDTAAALGNSRRRFLLEKRSSFVPKGKTRPLTVYRCNWQRHKQVSRDIKTEAFLPVPPRQTRELALYLLIGSVALYLIWRSFIFYLLADFEFFALYFLAPHPALTIGLLILAGGGLVFGLILLLRRVKQVPPWALKLLKGFFGFGIGFLIILALARVIPDNLSHYWNGSLAESEHLFVKVVQNEVRLYSSPSKTGKALGQAKAGSVFLQNRIVKRNQQIWTKVLYQPKRYAYILRMTRPKLGIPAYRQTVSSKFYFRFHDLYALLAGLIGFIWGYLTFQIRPM